MADQLSEQAKQLIMAPNFGHVATVMPSGMPQVTPVWVDTDGTHLVFNTADGRQKTKNLERDSKVAVSIVDQSNPYSWVMIQGYVAEMTHEGADAHIDKMAKKYLGQDSYPYRSASEQRVIVKIMPENVATSG